MSPKGRRRSRDSGNAESDGMHPAALSGDSDVVLFTDTFTTWFEPENARAAVRVLEAAGYRVRARRAAARRAPPAVLRPDVPRRRPRRRRAAGACPHSLAALAPFIERGVPIVGLEPSCLLTFRDEALVLGFEREAGNARFVLFEELIAGAAADSDLDLRLRPLPARRALLHGHCHQKAFGVMPALESTLRLVPDLEVETVASSCCGMAGAFGYEAANYKTSRWRWASSNLLPAVRAADRNTVIVAGGTSCRHQIADGTAREAQHVATVLDQALP